MVKETTVLFFVMVAFSVGLLAGTVGRSSSDDSMRRTWSALSDSCRAEIEAAALDEDVQGKRRE